MTNVEKIAIIAIVVLFIAGMVSCGNSMKRFEDAGGMKQLIIDAGKEVKDISNQINDTP